MPVLPVAPVETVESGKVHFKKNMLKKTRSKKKNFKKDKRSIEDKQKKLGSKFVDFNN